MKMKIVSIINRYILKEFFAPFTVNVLFFTFIFLMAELIQITNWIVNYNINMATILLMILYQIPFLLIFVIPLSVMITVLLTFLRLSNENEILALKTGGISIYALLAPVLAFCFIGFVVTLVMSVYGQPRSRFALKELTRQIVSSNITIGLKERVFNASFGNVVIYVNKIDPKSRMLFDVFIEDNRQPDRINTVVAPRGEIFDEPENAISHLRLFNGSIHQTDLKEKTASSIQFERYDISLPVDRSPSQKYSKPKRPKEMNTGYLNRFVKSSNAEDDRYFRARLELHRRFAIPFGCFALGLLAVPLGVQSKSAKRSFGLFLGLAFYLFYYLLMSIGKIYGETGAYPPAIGMWLPNFVMGGLGLYFLIRTANERTLKVDVFYDRLQKLLFKWMR
ncbi:MAG: LPS export ABC transporter permease LptF [Desulfobacterales bacterium]|jgi:lipopolysaccharide export system permease protein